MNRIKLDLCLYKTDGCVICQCKVLVIVEVNVRTDVGGVHVITGRKWAGFMGDWYVLRKVVSAIHIGRIKRNIYRRVRDSIGV